jgi:hypothetical protein
MTAVMKANVIAKTDLTLVMVITLMDGCLSKGDASFGITQYGDTYERLSVDV